MNLKQKPYQNGMTNKKFKQLFLRDVSALSNLTERVNNHNESNVMTHLFVNSKSRLDKLTPFTK
jgi:hypothetical protein